MGALLGLAIVAGALGVVCDKWFMIRSMAESTALGISDGVSALCG